MGFLDWLFDPIQEQGLNVRPNPTGGMTSVTTAPTPAPGISNAVKYGAPMAVSQSGMLPKGFNAPPSNGRGGQQQGPATPTLADYLRSLGLSNSDFGANLPEAPDLTAGVSSQYSPIINYLQKSIGRTKNEGEEAGEDLGSIYGAMANMAKQSGKTINKQGKKSTKEIRRVYQQAERKRDEEIENDAERVTGKLEELGIAETLPASTKGMLKESAHQHRLIARQKSSAIGSSKLASDNWANFAKAGAQGARLEGAEAQAELSQNVADAVFGLRGQIAQSKAEKAAAMMQAQQAEYGMAMDAASAQNAAAMQKAGFAQQFQEMMMAQNAPKERGDLQGYDLVSSILRNEAQQEPGLNRGDAASALESLQGIIPGMSGGENQYGQPDTQVDPQEFYAQLRAKALEAGIPEELIGALMSKQVYSQFQ